MVDSSERRVIASLAQLVQSISFTPRGSEVRILQDAQKFKLLVSRKDISEKIDCQLEVGYG